MTKRHIIGIIFTSIVTAVGAIALSLLLSYLISTYVYSNPIFNGITFFIYYFGILAGCGAVDNITFKL